MEGGGAESASNQRLARPKALISSSQVNTDMQYSADGEKIVFGSTRTGDAEIWIADSDGHHETRLTTSTGPGVGSPSLSPDGKYVAYDSASNIYLISASGGKSRQLTTDGVNVMINMMPSWSHDSRWVYFTSNRRGPMEVWKIPVEGGQPQPITQHGGAEAKPSHDGETLYYSKSIVGDAVLWSVPAGGGPETPVGIPDVILRRQWDVSQDAIFFVRKNDSMVCRWDFKSRRVTALFPLEKKVGPVTRNFAASPNGRWVAWAPLDIDSRDINVVDHFR
jgi:Tol biopolymer transport system component